MQIHVHLLKLLMKEVFVFGRKPFVENLNVLMPAKNLQQMKSVKNFLINVIQMDKDVSIQIIFVKILL